MTIRAILHAMAIIATLAIAVSDRPLAAEAPSDNPAPEERSWRTITFGKHKGVDGYREALDAAGVRLGDSADEILGRPAFPYGTTTAPVGLVVLSVDELGAQARAMSLADVYARARQIGLDLCPAEVAPRLRLDYRDQPRGEFLHIAMEPIATYGGALTTLVVANVDGDLLLIGSDGRADFMAPRNWRFVFVMPAVTQRLEALRRSR
jgi:hypothetical protein